MIALLLGYLGFLVLIGMFVLTAYYHVSRYGLPGDRSRPVFWLYLFAVVLVIVASFVLIATTSWGGEG